MDNVNHKFNDDTDNKMQIPTPGSNNSTSLMVNLIGKFNEPIYRDAHAYLPPQYLYQSQKSDSKEDQDYKEDDPKYQSGTPTVISKYINTKPLPSTAKTYLLEKFKKNAMIIFNHENVEGYSEKRKGTRKDESALRETFAQFGFEIEETKIDLTKVELFRALEKFSEKDFTDYGCVVIVVLTHGTSGGLLRASDAGQLYHEQDIISQFKTRNKPTLITKPVILLIQACRGKASTKGVEVAKLHKMTVSKDHDEDLKPYHLPVESDMLLFHSSYAGKPSFRPENGSWFIQTLCQKINELYRTHDLESIFTEVKREVAVDKYYMELNFITNEMELNKQMPVVTSTLIRKLYLRKFNDKPPVLPHSIKQSDCETSTDSEPFETENDNGACCCFLDHFDYMKRCLRYIVQNNPKDTAAKSLLNIADYESGINEEKAKNTLILISSHIENHYKNTDYHKYVYFYESNCNIDAADYEQFETKSTFRRVTKKWNEWSRNNIVRSVGFCVGAYLVYNFINGK